MMKFVKSALVAAALFSVGSAFAEEKMKVEPGTGPTETMTKAVPTMTPDGTPAKMNCTTADIDATNVKIKAMTDTAKQKMAMDHMYMAKKSMDGKDMLACEMHMKEAMGSMGTTTK